MGEYLCCWRAAIVPNMANETPAAMIASNISSGLMPSVRDVAVRSDIPPLSRVVTREDVKAYADAGGDQNPLHQDEASARASGFRGIIAHGMFTMGHLASCVSAWAGGG